MRKPHRTFIPRCPICWEDMEQITPERGEAIYWRCPKCRMTMQKGRTSVLHNHD